MPTIQPQHDASVPAPIAYVLQRSLNNLNKADPPNETIPFFLANPRHICTAGTISSTHAEEIYATGFQKKLKPLRYVPITDNVSETEFAIIYREGRCESCQNLLRSRVGRVVRVAERPPLDLSKSDPVLP